MHYCFLEEVPAGRATRILNVHAEPIIRGNFSVFNELIFNTNCSFFRRLLPLRLCSLTAMVTIINRYIHTLTPRRAWTEPFPTRMLTERLTSRLLCVGCHRKLIPAMQSLPRHHRESWLRVRRNFYGVNIACWSSCHRPR